jgi:hypothetical protein
MAIAKKSRWTLLIIAVIVFIPTTYVVVLYAQGFRYDFQERRFTFTGAITLDVNTEATVFLDGQEIGGTSFLGKEFGEDKLLPGTYTVRLEREGYSGWSKAVIVQEGLVTDFPNVLLLDLDEQAASRSRAEIDEVMKQREGEVTPTPTASPGPAPQGYTLQNTVLAYDGVQIASGVLGYQESPDNEKLLWWTRNEAWALWLRDTDEQPFRKAEEQEAVIRLSTPINGATWWPDSEHVAVISGADYRVVELDSRGGTNIIRLK